MFDNLFCQPFLECLLHWSNLQDTLSFVSTCLQRSQDRRWIIRNYAVVDFRKRHSFSAGINPRRLRARLHSKTECEQVCIQCPDVTDVVFLTSFFGANYKMPPNVQHAQFNNYYWSIIRTFPITLTELKIDSLAGLDTGSVNLPPNLRNLTLGSNDNWDALASWPSTLTHLAFCEFGGLENDFVVPASVECLNLGHCFFLRRLRIKFPATLTHLTFLSTIFPDRADFCTLPTKLKSLSLGESFNEPLHDGFLPDSLQRLYFGNCFEQSLANIALPSGLTHLEFGCFYDKSLQEVSFPLSLRYLSIPANYPHNLPALPETTALVYTGAL